MNVAGLPDILQKVLPVLKALGIDPQAFASKWERDQLKARLDPGVPAVVARLDKDGMGKLLTDGRADSQRQYIRAALYLLLKEALKKIVPLQVAPHLADALRDAVDGKVVHLVQPQLGTLTTPQAVVRAIEAAYIEQVT